MQLHIPTSLFRESLHSSGVLIKPLKSEAIYETGLSGYLVASFFPLIIFILLCFNVLSTVPRENRLADFLYIYIYIFI